MLYFVFYASSRLGFVDAPARVLFPDDIAGAC